MMDRINVIADINIPFLQGVLEPYAAVTYLDARAIDRAAVAQADALLVRTRTRCDRALLEGSRVQFIATATIGFDHIETAFCDSTGIRWISAPGCNAASVEQYIASILAGMVVRQDYSWAGKTIGVVGVGHVGRRVAHLARQLGLRVLLNDPPRARMEGDDGFTELDILLSESDIITLHTPLNREGPDKTHHLIDSEKLRRFKKEACLINSSRGEVVDSQALHEALAEGWLRCAALDVWENEPRIDRHLLDRVIIGTPHIAGYSVDGKRNGTVRIVRGLAEHFSLPLKGWEPSCLPQPADPVIRLETHKMSPERAIAEAILQTYNAARDDRMLRSDPSRFEELRNAYPARREFPSYGFTLDHPDPALACRLKALGFNQLDHEQNHS